MTSFSLRRLILACTVVGGRSGRRGCTGHGERRI